MVAFEKGVATLLSSTHATFFPSFLLPLYIPSLSLSLSLFVYLLPVTVPSLFLVCFEIYGRIRKRGCCTAFFNSCYFFSFLSSSSIHTLSLSLSLSLCIFITCNCAEPFPGML